MHAGNNSVLKNIFGDILWNVIECLFEGWDFTPQGIRRYDEKAYYKGKVYNKARKIYSMESLMHNVVRNKGRLNYNGVLFE